MSRPHTKLVRVERRAERSLTKLPSGGKLRRWEAIGMGRATWYRHGKPTTKPEPKWTQRQLAEALGVSIRTIQRDSAAVKWKVVEEIRKAKAAGREMDVAAVEAMLLSQTAANLRDRETEARNVVEAGLETMQRLARLRDGKIAP
jgi:hypothetical protein